MINQQGITADTQALIEIGGKEVKNISGFSVSIDMMQMGDPFTLTIPNPRGLWTNILVPWTQVKLKMSNPNVNGGTPSCMHTGVVVGRHRTSDSGGSMIQLQCADLGWYLMTHCPEPHIRLEGATFAHLLSWALSPPVGDLAWGIKDVTADRTTSRLIRLGLNGGRQQAEAYASNDLIVFQAQTEPGVTLGSLLITYARRFNRIINMTPDGFLQVFTPDYAQAPIYHIDYHDYDDPDSVKNNVLSVDIQESADTNYGKVTVVGQIVGYALYDAYGYNPGKFLGVATNQGLPAGVAGPSTTELLGVAPPPVKHELTAADGDVYEPKWGPYAAGWRLKRGLWDAWTYTVKVRGHWQQHNHQRNWWISDTMCEVRDTVHNVVGNYYVAAVKLDRTSAGDTTEVTLKRPNLLAPNFANVVTELIQ